MSRHLATFALWLLLLFIADQLFTWAYNFVYFPLIDPATNSVRYGEPIPDLILLSTSVLIFAAAGALLAWRMGGGLLPIVLGMGLGCAWLAGEIAMRIPWFQLMPSHPSTYDRLMAFFGALSAPVAGAIGAYLFSRVRFRRVGQKHAT